ncbi:MAG: hypothetical protein Q8J89_00905 [Caulobacter sp.]|nr:hypothetical protein [Caulobacter sp.]
MKKAIKLAIAATLLALASGSAVAHRGKQFAEPGSQPAPVAKMSKLPARFQAGGLECSDAFFAAGCRTKRHCLRGCDAIFEVETMICAAVSPNFAACFGAASGRWKACVNECEEEFPF